MAARKSDFAAFAASARRVASLSCSRFDLRLASIASKAIPRLRTSPTPVAANGTLRSPFATEAAARDSCGRPRVAWLTDIRRDATRANREAAERIRNHLVRDSD